MKTIKVPKGTEIAVCGDIHEHSEQFFKLMDELKPSEMRWFVSVGDLIDKGWGIKSFELISDYIIELNNKKIGFAVNGNHEKKHLKRNKHNLTPQLQWLKNQPLSLTFEFHTGARLTVVHAGVTPKMTWDSLENDVEVCYVRDVDEDGHMIPLKWVDKDGKKSLVKAKEGGTSWHSLYNGRFGYIAAGHAPNYDGKPKFYNYSCNLDTAVFATGVLTAQVFTNEGKLGNIIQVTGTAFKPQLNEDY